MFKRYAVFYLPPRESALADFGAHWFGYDIRTGQFCDQIKVEEFNLTEFTKNARLYGLHATMKAPFQLRKKVTFDELCTKVAKQAQKSEPFTLSPMKITQLAGFPALMPRHHRAKLVHLEERLVTKLKKTGRKPDQETLDRRRAVKLNALESEYLKSYGYPYVLDHFRFHLTLCDKLEPNLQKQVKTYLQTRYEDVLTAALPIEEIALVGERESDGYFEEIERFPLRA